MARRGRRRLIVPEAEPGMEALKGQVMERKGYKVNPQFPDEVKYEVARSLGIPLRQGRNGKLTTEEAGRIGGPIGGAMVREMVKRAQARLVSPKND